MISINESWDRLLRERNGQWTLKHTVTGKEIPLGHRVGDYSLVGGDPHAGLVHLKHRGTGKTTRESAWKIHGQWERPLTKVTEGAKPKSYLEQNPHLLRAEVDKLPPTADAAHVERNVRYRIRKHEPEAPGAAVRKLVRAALDYHRNRSK